MRSRTGTIALAGLAAGALGLATPARAQDTAARRDSSHRFSLFGGTAAAESRGPETGLELGASGDFQWRPVPVPLRLSLSFSQRNDSYQLAPNRGGKASLETVLRPIARHFALQPYFLAGVGAATRAAYSGIGSTFALAPDGSLTTQPFFYTRERRSWMFASAGVGLDVGRAFVQVKVENPVASQGPIVIPLSVGFRFWD